MIEFDFHTHTTYSHGKGSILDNALSAKNKGIKGIGITDHGFNHPVFGMRRKQLQKMRDECEIASKQTGVKILLGTEANIIGLSGKTDLQVRDYEAIDLFLAGFHRVIIHEKFGDYFKLFGSNWLTASFKKAPSERLVKNTTTACILAIKNNPIDILTHLNYGYFCNSLEVANCLSDYGTYLEINTKKVHLSDQEWQDIIDKTKVNFVIDSDAHSPDRVGDDALAQDLFKRVSFPKERIFNINGKTPTLRFKEFKEKL